MLIGVSAPYQHATALGLVAAFEAEIPRLKGAEDCGGLTITAFSREPPPLLLVVELEIVSRRPRWTSRPRSFLSVTWSL